MSLISPAEMKRRNLERAPHDPEQPIIVAKREAQTTTPNTKFVMPNGDVMGVESIYGIDSAAYSRDGDTVIVRDLKGEDRLTTKAEAIEWTKRHLLPPKKTT